MDILEVNKRCKTPYNGFCLGRRVGSKEELEKLLKFIKCGCPKWFDLTEPEVVEIIELIKTRLKSLE